jgi:hypothetical protein
MKKWLLYALALSALLVGGLWAASAQQAPPKPPMEEPELEEFEPTEKVPADSSVSFPVDI